MNLQDRQILVTGGAGFIGGHLTEVLLERGANVDVIDNLFAGDEANVPNGATLHQLDLRDRGAVTEVLEGLEPSVVFHLAAIHYVPYCNKHPMEAVEVNISATRNLLDSLSDIAEVDRYVFASSGAVYPPRDESNREDSEIGPIDIYGETKLIGEELARLFHHDQGVTTMSARLFNVYGSRETNAHLIPAIIDQLRDGRNVVELGNLSPSRDFIHVDDVVEALLAMVTGFDGGYRTYNVGTGDEFSVAEVVDSMASALGEEIDVVQSEERQRDADRQHLLADIERIEQEIGWTPSVSFVNGLRRLLRAEELIE